MGTTADKLNRLINTKESIRQEINRAYGSEEVSTSDTFNSYIQKLEDHPFYLLEYLEKIIENVKDSSATIIGKNAFRSCTGLRSVSFLSATNIDNGAFQGCTGLRSVSFPNARNIGRSTFQGCTGFSSVSFPNVTHINDDAFRSCGRLTTASFPKLAQIADGKDGWMNRSGAFYGCGNLTTLYIGTETSSVCKLGTGAFQNCSNLTNIYVPASLVDSYKSATNWSNYADRIKAAP